MASLVVSLSVALLLAQPSTAFNCSQPPIFVDVHKRAVHDSNVFQYGSFIGLGTPAQNHSLWPSLSQNYTSFAPPDFCKSNQTTLPNCFSNTGGFYDHSQSSSFVSTANGNLDHSNPNLTFGSYGTENLRLYTHYFETDPASQTVVNNTAISIATSGSIRPAIVGIGSSSTLMHDLYAQNLIAGKTYSLYIGAGFDRAGGVINGSSVFGGYDSGRFTGDVHQYPMNFFNQNSMSVQIKDITITNSNGGGNTSLFDNTKFTDMKSSPPPFDAQITTDQFPLKFPAQITKNFMKLLNAVHDSNNTWGDNSLKLNDAFNGTLTITLSDGFQVTLPPEVLMNASNITPIQENDSDDGPFYLGTAFLGQTYLMADFEDEVFFLAQAIIKNNMVMPLTFCPKTTPAAYIPPHQSRFVAQGLIGAVIGGVIGGLGVITAVALCWISWIRKKDERKLKRELKANHKHKMSQMEIEDAPMFDPPPTNAAKAIFIRRNKGWLN